MNRSMSKKMGKALKAIIMSVCFVTTGMASSFTSVSAAPREAQLVRIHEGGTSSASRSLKLGLNKAAIIELPLNASDVLVSNPEIVDAVVRTPRRTYLIGMKVGQTNAFFFDRKGEQILNLEIQVEHDLSILDEAFKKYLPEARITLAAMNNNVVLNGFVPNASQSRKASDLAARFIGAKEQVLNMLAIEGTEQVMLKVVVAEMQRSLIKQLGVDLSQVLNAGNVAFNLATDNTLSLAGSALGGLTGTATKTAGSSVSGVTLQAFERAGLVRTLAEPNLTAISGETATFLAGGEFPVGTGLDTDGNVRIEFKPFGVSLAFTPVVMSEGRISMKVSTEVSELTSEGAFVLEGINNLTVPALRVRRAETMMELPSGGSMMMAGLISESTLQNLDGVPGAKDVPVLGQLFRSRDFQSKQTELVVIVTPYLVKPTSRDKLVLPTDGFAPASDMDTILMGQLNATYNANPDQPRAGKLEGPVGFIVD